MKTVMKCKTFRKSVNEMIAGIEKQFLEASERAKTHHMDQATIWRYFTCFMPRDNWEDFGNDLIAREIRNAISRCTTIQCNEPDVTIAYDPKHEKLQVIVTIVCK